MKGRLATNPVLTAGQASPGSVHRLPSQSELDAERVSSRPMSISRIHAQKIIKIRF